MMNKNVLIFFSEISSLQFCNQVNKPPKPFGRLINAWGYGFVITWIFHQIIMYSNKVKLVAGLDNDSPNPPPLPQMNELTNK